MYGAQYLHAGIPGLTPEAAEFQVSYDLVGSVADYAVKVYGEKPPDFVSPEKFLGVHGGWDIRSAYQIAWSQYSSHIIDLPGLDAEAIDMFLKSGEFDLIISSIPAPDICKAPGSHNFLSRHIWAVGDAPELGISAPLLSIAHNAVICNGEPDTGWYRASNIQGFRTMEWPGERRPPIEDIAWVNKPIRNTCDCWADTGKVWRVGRYGSWDKKALAHTAYWDVREAIEGDLL